MPTSLVSNPLTVNTLFRYNKPFYPKDSKWQLLEAGQKIQMPPPNKHDNYDEPFIATVQDIMDESGNLMVSSDDDGAYHEIEPSRVTIISNK